MDILQQILEKLLQSPIEILSVVFYGGSCLLGSGGIVALAIMVVTVFRSVKEPIKDIADVWTARQRREISIADQRDKLMEESVVMRDEFRKVTERLRITEDAAQTATAAATGYAGQLNNLTSTLEHEREDRAKERLVRDEEHRQKWSTLTEEIDKATRSAEQANNRAKKLEEDLSKLQNEKRQIEVKLNQATAKLSEQIDLNKQLDGKLATQITAMSTMSNHITDLEARISVMTTDLNDARRERDEAYVAVADANKRAETAYQALSEANERIVDFRSRLEILEKSNGGTGPLLEKKVA